MKRGEVTRGPGEFYSPNDVLLCDCEETERIEKANLILGLRMLENLKTALFFSRMQNQADNENKESSVIGIPHQPND